MRWISQKMVESAMAVIQDADLGDYDTVSGYCDWCGEEHRALLVEESGYGDPVHLSSMRFRSLTSDNAFPPISSIFFLPSGTYPTLS